MPNIHHISILIEYDEENPSEVAAAASLLPEFEEIIAQKDLTLHDAYEEKA